MKTELDRVIAEINKYDALINELNNIIKDLQEKKQYYNDKSSHLYARRDVLIKNEST